MVLKYKPFCRKLTIHNNEHVVVYVNLVPPNGEVLPSVVDWGFSIPVLRADESTGYGVWTYDSDTNQLRCVVDPGNYTGRVLIDILTDLGSSGLSFRLGTIRLTVLEGAGAYD